MTNIVRSTVSHLALAPLLGALVIGLTWPLDSAGQDQAPASTHQKRADGSASTDKDLAAQLHDMQAKLTRLEAALKQGHKAMPSGAPDAGGAGRMPMGPMANQKMGMGMMGMGGMEGEGMDRDEMMQMMQMMGKMMQMMGQMQGKGMSGMGDKQKMGMGDKGMGMMADDMQEMMGMMGMGNMGQGGMKGMGGTSMPSALPGFPGASHIYHIGATGFFLDHPEHIKLTTKQQTDLNSLKETALLEKSSSQRRIDEADQELWTLTAADKPDASKIDAKVREIEKLRGDQRLAFIRAVGEAAKVLTDDQRQALLGFHADKPSAHTGH